MKIVGITGRTGSGKSFASKVLSDLGGFVIDLDKIGHMVYENKECLNEVSQNICGEFIINGVFDRKKLSQIVFSNYDYLEILTKITDKYIFKLTNEIIKNNNDKKFFVLDGALIFESKILELCDCIILIRADEQVSVNRIIKRDNISYEFALKRIKSQKDYTDYFHDCKYIITNNDEDDKIVDEIKNIVSIIIK